MVLRRDVRRGVTWALRRLGVGMLVAVLLLAPGLSVPSHAAVPVLRLRPSVLPAPVVGTSVTWSAVLENSAVPKADLRYRFEIGLAGQPTQMRQDFNPRSSVRWVPLQEGTYTVTVTARRFGATTAWSRTTSYRVRSRLTGDRASVSATAHPLVALYSAPPCRQGSVGVRFRAVGEARWTAVPRRACDPDRSANFLVAGLRATTRYAFQHDVRDGSRVTWSRTSTWVSGRVAPSVPRTRVVDRVDASSSTTDGILLHSIVFNPTSVAFPLATDLAGRTVWYYPLDDPTTRYLGPFLTGPVAGGTMLLHLSDLTSDGLAEQVLREVDLLGTPVRETTVERINEQLAVRGEDQITAFTHDAIRLPDGRTVVLGYVERLLSDVQGPGPVDILGDMVIVLDQELQVAWTWNAFDHLDPRRRATLGETCSLGTIGCPILRLARTAHDWAHTNTVAYSPSDGNLLLSIRNQDWLVKIDYRDGSGTGDIVWRLGEGGDFAIRSPDQSPWFDHQHDAHYEGAQIVVFDNGNVRCQGRGPTCHSRGQVLEVDEQTRVARLVLNADLGYYAEAYGAAERLSNGNAHFTVGTLGRVPHSRSVEVRPDASVSYQLQVDGVAYRSFRMRDLYTP